MDLNCSKKERKRNHYYKLNNFQLFKKDDSNMRTTLKKDLVIYYDLSNNRSYSKNNDEKGNFKNKCKRVDNDGVEIITCVNRINSKHYSYDRYLAKRKGIVMHKMISDNMNYKTKMKKVDKNFNYDNKLHNPCTWKNPYKNYMNYGNQPKDKKYPSQHPNFIPPLPTGPVGAKSCNIYNCQKLGKS